MNLSRRGRSHALPVFGGHAVQQRPELQVDEELPQAASVRFGDPERLEIVLDGNVRTDRDEILGHEDVFTVLLKRFSGPLPRYLVGMLENALNGAIGFQELDRRLGTDPRSSRDVVRRVTHEGQIVRDPLGWYAKLVRRIAGVHPIGCDAVRSPAPRVQKMDTVSHQLVEVLVARDDDGLETLIPGLDRQRADDVIRLPPIHGDDAVAEGLHELADHRKAGTKLLRHLLPRGLVVREDFLTVGTPRVEDHGDVVRLVVVPDAEEEVDEPEGRRRVLAAGVGQGSVDEGEERPVDQRICVDQKEAGNGLRGNIHDNCFGWRGGLGSGLRIERKNAPGRW